jgi:hypothetical protein
MFTPAEPKAGPTGGEGLAAPPFTWSFTILKTFLAIFCFLKFLIYECGSIYKSALTISPFNYFFRVQN